MKSRYQRSLSAFAFIFFMGVGTYNAVVINSESHISGANLRFVKRLDEMYGDLQPARLVATSVHWKKLPQSEIPQQKLVVQEITRSMSAPENAAQEAPATEAPVTAAVQEELNLNLIEVVNPKKWQQGLQPAQFTGNLTTSNGSIENLSVTLPDGDGLSISFSEMSGNVFEYDHNGEIYTGMMYQVDQSAYMVTLSNGPLEGTRMKFLADQSEKIAELEAQQVEQQGTNSESDNFGQPAEGQEVALNQDGNSQETAPQAQEVPLEQVPNDFQPSEELPQEPQVVMEGGSNPQEAMNLDLQYQLETLQANGVDLEQLQVN